ncbi:telomeric repeat-binding factor 1 isoform X1 [Pelobates cultripes]|uniref:Telomeric repeat-binding factor n=1 Tax=Pelobates cultripes TaxID=61616 RepID=A0AAD1S3B5_PELCU|nr:telomeric repeat-binding factor 1 isoform X1 [Pelobates cultripes]
MATGTVEFDEVVKVANDWVFDFMFASLCHYFKEERAVEFHNTCRAMEVLLEGMTDLDNDRKKAVLIAQFITRVAEGKQLDSQFESDERITPLESAVFMLEKIEEKEKHLINLQKDIKLSVKVQAVAVCMEKGRFNTSSEVLDRQFSETGSYKYLKMKLAMIVGKKDPYHGLLQNMSYKTMLKKINTYLDLTLKGRQSPFLLKVATKVVEAKDKITTGMQSGKDGSLSTNERIVEDGVSFLTDDTVAYHTKNPCTESSLEDIEVGSPLIENESQTEQEDESQIEQENIYDNTDQNLNTVIPSIDRKEVTDTDKHTKRHQKRLFSLEQRTPWNPYKPSASKKLMSNIKLRKRSQRVATSTQNKLPSKSSASKRKHWTWEEDELLKKGVNKYGVGNWSKILVHYEFNNRTGVMLKDRWRTMKKLNIVGSGDES